MSALVHQTAAAERPDAAERQHCASGLLHALHRQRRGRALGRSMVRFPAPYEGLLPPAPAAVSPPAAAPTAPPPPGPQLARRPPAPVYTSRALEAPPLYARLRCRGGLLDLPHEVTLRTPDAGRGWSGARAARSNGAATAAWFAAPPSHNGPQAEAHPARDVPHVGGKRHGDQAPQARAEARAPPQLKPAPGGDLTAQCTDDARWRASSRAPSPSLAGGGPFRRRVGAGTEHPPRSPNCPFSSGALRRRPGAQPSVPRRVGRPRPHGPVYLRTVRARPRIQPWRGLRGSPLTKLGTQRSSPSAPEA